MRGVALPLLVIVVLLQAVPAAARPQLRPRVAAVALESSASGLRLHVELAQPPGSVRSMIAVAGRKRLRMRAIRRAGHITVWHSAPRRGRAAAELGAVRSVALRISVRAGSTRTLGARIGPALTKRRPAGGEDSNTGPSATAPAPPAAAAAAAEAAVTTEPALVPALDSQTTDHVVRCTPPASVRIEVQAPADALVAIDGAPPRTGDFTVSLALTAGDAFTIARGDRTDHVRCLPADFPAWTAEHGDGQQAQWYLVTPNVLRAGTQYAAILDRAGTPVWWAAAPRGALDMKLLPDSTIAWSRFAGVGVGLDPDGAYEVRALDGSLLRIVSTSGVPTDHHDLQSLANGGALLVAYRPRAGADLSPWGGPGSATVLDPVVQEIGSGGELRWEWDGSDHIGLAESARFLNAHVIGSPLPGELYDTTHINSVEPDGDGVIVSIRHTDAVYRVDRATGAVAWKLGGSATPESLEILDEDPDASARFGGQHDARRLADGTLSVFDNGSGRDRAPRALRYAIDAERRTATLLESIADPAVPQSPCCGSARRLPGGNWVIAWGGTPRMTEATPAGKPVFTLLYAGTTATYRAVPVLPGVLGAGALRAGMDAATAGPQS